MKGTEQYFPVVLFIMLFIMLIPNFAIQLYFEIDARRDSIAYQFVPYTNTVIHK